MIKIRLAQLGLAMAAIGFTAVSPVIGLSNAYAAEALRPEVGKPLQAAQQMMKSGHAREALAELKKLDSVSGKTPSESYLIERVRASAASSAGDYETAARSFETLIASGKLSAQESENFSEGLVGIYMRAREFGKANATINKQLAKGPNARMRGFLIQNYVSMGNIGEAMRLLNADIKGAKTPQEDQLKMLANLQNLSGDKAGYVQTIERLAANYPQPSYWADLLNRVAQKPGFAASRLAIDVLRLKLANNLIKKPAEYMELAQLVLRDGAGAEAVHIIERGYKAGALGVGPDAPRHQRLKDLADKTLADANKNLAVHEAALVKAADNDGLLNLGYGLVQAGQADKGLKMMEAAIKADRLKNPEDAKLRLGEAYAAAGKKQQAIAALKNVGGKDGTAELARYWIMAINHPMG
jgi:hypothetical protein